MIQNLFEFATNQATPMMKQYLTIKSQYPECILFYRMGDFYEMFFEDAITASNILGITLTKRGKHENLDIPMCGVPYHSSDNYLQTLISKGLKVAICEQIESPQEAKKRGYKAVVKREVVRIITPGTITEENLLNSRSSNYLMSIIKDQNEVVLAFADISTGELATLITNLDSLNAELSRLNPAEILISEQIYKDPHFLNTLGEHRKIITSQVSSFFEFNKCLRRFKDQYQVLVLDSFGDFSKNQICAIGSLLEYINLTQKRNEIKIDFPKSYNSQNFMIIDQATRNNLELTNSNSPTKENSSLLHAIDNTKTNMGGRLLRSYLSSPLLDISIINTRLDLVEFFVKQRDILGNIQDILSSISDTERAISRLLLLRGSARDMLALKNDLVAYQTLKKFLYQNCSEIISILENHLNYLDGFDQLISIIDKAIIDEPPLLIRDGGFIKKGFDHKLDQLFEINQNSNLKIQELKQKYANITGISNLKITKNNILGYFIEVTPSNLNRINQDHFILRQSMVNASRFTTIELRNLEEDISNSTSKIISIELEIYDKLLETIASLRENISIAAKSIAVIDYSVSLAHLAAENNYSRPEIVEDKSFVVKNCRHPVVENFLKQQNKEYTPNDIDFNANTQVMLLTGPNMAGKSTYLRQNAICAILAQIGSFIPASYGKIGIVDRVFSRVGASDDLAGGKSTFMVEMVETATILNQASNRSLVIVDEIGRGTSTYDGLAIAKSILEHIANKINCRTIFATHYHELVSIENEISSIKNYTVEIKEWNSNIIFLHKVIPGFVDKSYGIHVAQLAGLPKSVLIRANQILESLEGRNINFQIPHQLNKTTESQLVKELKEINIDDFSPRQALDFIYKLKNITG
jgi:DNA mismatch repair protein MutS